MDRPPPQIFFWGPSPPRSSPLVDDDIAIFFTINDHGIISLIFIRKQGFIVELYLYSLELSFSLLQPA